MEERNLYCDVFNNSIVKLNKKWNIYFPDVNLDNPNWLKRYNRFIQTHMQIKFDRLNEEKSGRILNWYVADDCDIYARIKHLPFTKIEVYLINPKEEEPE